MRSMKSLCHYSLPDHLGSKLDVMAILSQVVEGSSCEKVSERGSVPWSLGVYCTLQLILKKGTKKRDDGRWHWYEFYSGFYLYSVLEGGSPLIEKIGPSLTIGRNKA